MNTRRFSAAARVFPLAVMAGLSAACANEDADTRNETSGVAADQAMTGAAANAAAAATPLVLSAADSTMLAAVVLTVHKSPTCGCCSKWVDHMRNSGFKVEVQDHDDVLPEKRRLGVHSELHSCHTATIGDYVLEGHVPAADVMRMLREKPQIAGLAVPGMPMGSPGMEGPYADKYDVLTFDKSGKTSIYSSH